MLQGFNTTLVEAIGPLGPQIAVGGLGLLLILITVPVMLRRPADPLDKIRNASRGIKEKKPAEQALRVQDKSAKLEKFKTFLEPQDAEQLSSSRLKMVRAGYRGKGAVRTFHAAQLVLALTFLVFGVIYSMITAASQTEADPMQMLVWGLLPAAAGYYIPIYWVNRRVQTRQEEMINGFPDSLDMMLVCVEAGQSLDQSIIRVSKEIKLGYPALGEEYAIVAHELKAGKERIQVLRDFAERAGVPDIASFVTTLVQSATFGTSIADALRVYGAEMRDKRVMRAEEKANILPTKLTLGTMLFTVPPLMIILIGPSLHGIATTMGGNSF